MSAPPQPGRRKSSQAKAGKAAPKVTPQKAASAEDKPINVFADAKNLCSKVQQFLSPVLESLAANEQKGNEQKGGTPVKAEAEKPKDEKPKQPAADSAAAKIVDGRPSAFDEPDNIDSQLSAKEAIREWQPLLNHLYHRLMHWGPITALVIIKFIFLTTVFVTSIWLPPQDSARGFVNHLVYVSWVGVVLYNFFTACAEGPGFVPKGWRPPNEVEEQFLQFCTLCESFKAPRSHHCRRCQRCVLKMDHHCPWINTCVGLRNQRNFCFFLFFCITGAIHSMVLLVLALLKAYNAEYYEEQQKYEARMASWYGKTYPDPDNPPEPIVHLTFLAVLCAILSLGLALGVIIALSGLLYVQLKIAATNQTTIEQWIVQKANMRERDDEFVYPYNLGITENLRQVFLYPLGDGITWPVAPGCNQYTLTVEQILQKADKRLRTRTYTVVREYHGSFFPPLRFGCAVCMSTPMTDEPRLVVYIGDRILVTRWKRHWLYGERSSGTATPAEDAPKGWFPRACAVESTSMRRNNLTDSTATTSGTGTPSPKSKGKPPIRLVGRAKLD